MTGAESRSPIFEKLLPYPLRLLAVIICYAQTVGFGVTAFDDDKIIDIFAGHHYSVADALTSNAFMEHKGKDFYRPLQSLVFMADAAFSGADPAAWHAANLIIHFAALCSLFQLLLLLGFGRLRSTGAALLFGVQPVFAQAAAWIPGCGDLLLGFCGFVALAALIRYRRTGLIRHFLLHAAALAGALLSKENGIALPVLFAVYILLTERKQAFSKSILPLAAVWGAEGAGYLMMHGAAIAGLPAEGTFGLRVLAGNLKTLPEVVSGLVMPFDLPVMPSFTAARTAAGTIFLVALMLVLAKRGRLGKSMVLFGSLWFLVLSIPGMMYRQELGGAAFTYLYHRSYLPLAGLWIVLLEAAPVIGSLRIRRYAMAALAIAAVTLIALTRYQASFFSNPAAFYNQAIKTNPHSAFALNNRARNRSKATLRLRR